MAQFNPSQGSSRAWRLVIANKPTIRTEATVATRSGTRASQTWECHRGAAASPTCLYATQAIMPSRDMPLKENWPLSRRRCGFLSHHSLFGNPCAMCRTLSAYPQTSPACSPDKLRGCSLRNCPSRLARWSPCAPRPTEGTRRQA